jgi:ribonuclease HII
MARKTPSFEIEKNYWRQNLSVAGIDEVGRGSFAGPVVAAAVIFPQDFTSRSKLFREINDSKLLSPIARRTIAKFIMSVSVFSISEVDVSEINHFGIGYATQKAMQIAVDKLSLKPDFSLLDGYSQRGLSFAHIGIVKGDRKSISIAAASIIAKVYRDNLMEQLHAQYKEYDFFQNKGYGTAKHRLMLKKFGLSSVHRTSFGIGKYAL